MLDGLCAFPLTPLSETGVDETALTGLISRLVEAGVDSIGVLGSTGLYPYLDRAERSTVLEAAVAAAAGTPVIAGIGALRTREVLTYAQDAQTAGAAGVLLAPVSYHRLSEEEVYGLYRDVTSAVSLPVIIYDNPGTTGFTFTDELYTRLVQLPNITGIKIPPPDPDVAHRVTALRSGLPGSVSVGISGDWVAAEALLAGADCWYSVIGGVFPTTAQAIVDATIAGHPEHAQALSQGLEPIWALFRRYGSLRVMAAIAETFGWVAAPSLPRPLLGLSPQARTELEAALQATGLAG
ncbi:dihydrodipicolinate synthase family protein [Kocuria rosea subsp. polaris]|uniref:Dihydrodipicolinate synthase family protein n=1 Tax=Kocuria rosea subsp. polaris TaxID=136273 RepID=A0A0W8ILT3_KOCRO|nr:dihydrodipicolinate synthase family protein [Kocuria polaris]KUG61009.1 dihydrodipicolinate synthase family protein [Kocuria polaris]